jgi:hypothetical protein
MAYVFVLYGRTATAPGRPIIPVILGDQADDEILAGVAAFVNEL